MIERAFMVTGYLSTALMAGALIALWLQPDSRWAGAVVYLAMVLLMLTPVTRVMISCVRYMREGDRRSALLTAGILVVVAVSGWVGWTR